MHVRVRAFVFPGTNQERDALLAAVARHCPADPEPRGAAVQPHECAVHALLLAESVQKRLIFYRRWRASLRRSEWLQAPNWSGRPRD